MPDTAVEILRRLGQPHGDADLLLAGATWDGLVPAAVEVGAAALPAHRERRLSALPGPPMADSGAPPPAGLIDTHCHLELLEDTERDLAAAWEAGLEAVVAIGFDLDSSRQAAGLARRHERVYAVVGLYPHEAPVLDDGLLGGLEELAREPKVVAIGECGLDYYRDHCPRDAQRRAFSAQIDLARRTGLPLVVHTREAADDTLRRARRGGRRPHRRHALFLAPRPRRRVQRARLLRVVRRQRDLQERRRPARARPRASATTSCSSRPTPRT